MGSTLSGKSVRRSYCDQAYNIVDAMLDGVAFYTCRRRLEVVVCGDGSSVGLSFNYYNLPLPSWILSSRWFVHE